MDGSKGPYFRLKLKGGKTNQLNQPDHRCIGSAPGPLCPYDLTVRYKARLTPESFLQPYCSPSDRTKPDLNKNRPIYYSSALNDFRNVMTTLGYNGEEFSEHSHKRGAATDGDAAGMTESEIQEQGHWTNPRTTRLYIDKKDDKSLAYQVNLIRKMF